MPAHVTVLIASIDLESGPKIIGTIERIFANDFMNFKLIGGNKLFAGLIQIDDAADQDGDQKCCA